MVEDPADTHILKHLANFVLAHGELQVGKRYRLEAVVTIKGTVSLLFHRSHFVELPQPEKEIPHDPES
jgi:hypothetical protein